MWLLFTVIALSKPYNWKRNNTFLVPKSAKIGNKYGIYFCLPSYGIIQQANSYTHGYVKVKKQTGK